MSRISFIYIVQIAIFILILSDTSTSTTVHAFSFVGHPIITTTQTIVTVSSSNIPSQFYSRIVLLYSDNQNEIDETNETLLETDTIVAEELSRKERKARERQEDYETRRQAWMERYGSVEALRKSFGTAPPWGDLDPEQTRQLYHTLLPRSLLALNEAGLMEPDELAPLAYQARVAAKSYARERCTVPGRILAKAFDGYRSFRRDGTFQTKGLSWEQIWDKYEAQIFEEECVQELKGNIDEDALTSRIYLRILERSCVTNKAFDKMFLQNDNNNNNGNNKNSNQIADLTEIANKLENDVRAILLQPKKAKKLDKHIEKIEKKEQKIQQKIIEENEKLTKKEREKRVKALRKRIKLKRKNDKKRQESVISDQLSTTNNGSNKDDNNDIGRRKRAYHVLRWVIGNRRKFDESKELE